MREGALAATLAGCGPGESWALQPREIWPQTGITNVAAAAAAAGRREAGREAQSGASAGRLAFPPAGFMEVTAAPHSSS